MAAERLSMRQLKEVLRQKWVLGRSHRQIASSVGIEQTFPRVAPAARWLTRAAKALYDAMSKKEPTVVPGDGGSSTSTRQSTNKALVCEMSAQPGDRSFYRCEVAAAVGADDPFVSVVPTNRCL